MVARSLISRVIAPAITKSQARRLWLHAQRLDDPAPFGADALAVPACVKHLGYVQIDTIHVIERCHHHILYSRIPDYQREWLRQAQSVDKTVFEYWTHALSYVSTGDMRFYVRDMRRYWTNPGVWFESVTDAEVRKVLARLRNTGPLTIRDINDDVLVEKSHEWGSRKPSKRALQLAFYKGLVTISQRTGMLKTYDLLTRHFGLERLPAVASEQDTLNYLLDRALRSQAIVSLDSVCFLGARRKAAVRRLVEARVKRGELVAVNLDGARNSQHWVRPETLEQKLDPTVELTHVLSPFDPLIAQRKRLHLFFDYEHRFEAYVPKHKRVFGYFVCPVLSGEEIVAALDLKTDRETRRLLIQNWTWVGRGKPRTHKKQIEEALHRFERFQLAS